MMTAQELDNKITGIVPVFESSTLGGHFAVTFGIDNKFRLSFVSFLKHRFDKDDKLKHYVRNAEDKGITAAAIVQDLYDIGCPIEDWVTDHFQDAREQMPTQFDLLLQLYLYLKQLNNDDHGSTRDDE